MECGYHTHMRPYIHIVCMYMLYTRSQPELFHLRIFAMERFGFRVLNSRGQQVLGARARAKSRQLATQPANQAALGKTCAFDVESLNFLFVMCFR